MNRKHITLYHSGFECPDCRTYNKEIHFYVYKCGDVLFCQRCRHEFLVATMTIEIDPYLKLEKLTKELQIGMDKLVKDFYQYTGVIPILSTNIDSKTVNISISQKPKYEVGECDDLSD